MKDCLKKVYFLTISVFLFHCSMNMEDKVLLDKEQIIDSNFSQSFVENFNKNKNFSSSYNIFFSEEIDEKLISSFMKGIEFGFFSNQDSMNSKLSFIAFNEESDCSTIKARGFNLILVSDINSEFYRKCKRRLSRNSLFTSINIDNENEFIQIDEKSLLITGKNRNSKNNENTSKEDTAASLSNMIGEIIGTISYLNALLCNENKVYFLGRTSLNSVIKTGIEDRLKLANISGVFKENREYGNVLGALRSIQSD